MLDFVKNISEASDNDKLTLGVFMDLSKALNTIDHNILLDAMPSLIQITVLVRYSSGWSRFY